MDSTTAYVVLAVSVICAVVVLASVRIIADAAEAIAAKALQAARMSGDKAVEAASVTGVRAAEALASAMGGPARDAASATDRLSGAVQGFRYKGIFGEAGAPRPEV
jgi:hypothetical protein